MNMEAMAAALRDSAIKPTGLETTDLRLRAMGLNKAPLMSVALILSTFLFFCGRISYRKKKKHLGPVNMMISTGPIYQKNTLMSLLDW